MRRVLILGAITIGAMFVMPVSATASKATACTSIVDREGVMVNYITAHNVSCATARQVAYRGGSVLNNPNAGELYGPKPYQFHWLPFTFRRDGWTFHWTQKNVERFGDRVSATNGEQTVTFRVP